MMVGSLRIHRDHMLLGACILVALALGALPPLRAAGMPMWFYLAPTLLAAYCVSWRAYLIGGLALMLVAAPLLGQTPQTFFPVVITSFLIGLIVSLFRQLADVRETLLVSVAVLLILAYPLLIFVYDFLVGLQFSHATLLSSRYVVQSLVAILMAEVVVLAATLTDWRWLGAVRSSLGFRPSLTQVVELMTTVAVTLSLLFSLIMFWRSWEADLLNDMQVAAETRIEGRLSSASISLGERLRLAVDNASLMDQKPAVSLPEVLTALAWFLDVDEVDPTSGERLASLAVYRGGEIGVTAGWSEIDARRALSFAGDRLDHRPGVVAFEFELESGDTRPVTALNSESGWLLLLCFRDLVAAEGFEFDRVIALEPADSAVSLVPGAYNPNNEREDFGVPDTAAITQTDGRVLFWTDESETAIRAARTVISSLTPGLTAVYKPSEAQLARYGRSLHGADRYRAEVNVWNYFIEFAYAVSFSTAIDIFILGVLLVVTRTLVGRLVSPLGDLTRIFESWRQFRGGELGSGAALQAMDSTGLSALRDIHSLQQGFRALAQDVMYGERRLSTIAANYDELLRSLPLGVLAVDGASRVQFLNDALGEMTGQRQDALQRLKAQAAQMLANNVRVEEWQLVLEDVSPKSLLLVVNHRLDERGQESGLWVIVTDLTEQKQTSAQLVQASKLATLGEMSTGMAHELNQPLNVISLATSNLRFTIKKGKATPDNTLSKLDRIDGAVHRAANIIDHMRAYGRLAGEGLTEINLGEVVGGACNLLGEQLKLANIALLNEVPETGLVVKGNAIQLEQVLINLVNNAKDAIKETGNAGTITVDSEVGGGRVRVRVTDTGGGIPSHVLPHVFEPFFTTKPVGKGTGLGGSISYGIIREMQGDIWAENVKEGAQITISLPLVEAAAGG
jgi:signal transduction histidine kinase